MKLFQGAVSIIVMDIVYLNYYDNSAQRYSGEGETVRERERERV